MPKLFYTSNRQPSVPKYRLHRPSGQAVVTVSGKDRYLGPWTSKASRVEYDRLIGEWLVQGRPSTSPNRQPGKFTVVELVAAYWRHAKTHYVKNGQPTDELPGLKIALRGQVTMERVLELLDYRATSRRGEQLRGACPFHASETSSPRCFSVHLSRGLFHCFQCGVHGNQLDLWSQVRGLSIHDAALDLGRRLGIFALDRDSESR